jgi:hypothetical protein
MHWPLPAPATLEQQQVFLRRRRQRPYAPGTRIGACTTMTSDIYLFLLLVSVSLAFFLDISGY